MRRLGGVVVFLVLVSACGDSANGAGATTESTADGPATTDSIPGETTTTTILSTTASTSDTSATATSNSSGQAGGSLFDILSSTPYPTDGLPSTSIDLVFELAGATPQDGGGTVFFKAVPSAGTSVDVAYLVGATTSDPDPAFLETILELGGTNAESFDPDVLIDGFGDPACTRYTTTLGLDAAACAMQSGEDVVFVRTILVLFEEGQSNESITAEMLAHAANHYFAVKESIAG